MWEKREIPRPPDYTLEYLKEDLTQNSLGLCAQSLLDGIHKGCRVLGDQELYQCLQKEVGILTACLYQNGRHRTEKFYRVLRKVEKTCSRWQQLGLVDELARLSQLMPSVILHKRSLRLPSKQMFEYLLVRLLGGYHLMLHIDRVCKEAAGLLMAKIKTGHFFSTAVVFLSVVARIRALGLDLVWQTARIYDDIFPLVNHLKASKAPPLVDTAMLPYPLTDLLQQYCSTLDISMDSQPMDTPTPGTSFLDSLAKEDGGYASKSDNTVSFPVCKITVDKNFNNAKTKQSVMRVDTYPSNSLLDEDIGVCVELHPKPHKKNKVKKRKQNLQDFGDSELIPDYCNSAKKVKSVNQPPLISEEEKPKKDVMNTTGGETRKKSTISKTIKKPQNIENYYCSRFIKLFKDVKKQTSIIDSVSSLRKFLKSETKNRQEKVKGRVSRLLKEEEWSKFQQYIRKRLENIQGLSLDDSSAVQCMIGKTRVRVKFWLLFPHLKGKKPENWKAILGTLAT